MNSSSKVSLVEFTLQSSFALNRDGNDSRASQVLAGGSESRVGFLRELDRDIHFLTSTILSDEFGNNSGEIISLDGHVELVEDLGKLKLTSSGVERLEAIVQNRIGEMDLHLLTSWIIGIVLRWEEFGWSASLESGTIEHERHDTIGGQGTSINLSVVEANISAG